MEFVADLLAQGTAPTCASEPIHIPSSIQPHGLLLLFDEASATLVHWAGDFDRHLGLAPAVGLGAEELLGAPLDVLIGARPLLPGAEAAYLGDIRPDGRPRLAIQAHRTGPFLAVELQPAGDDASATPALEEVRAISERIAAKATLAEACDAAAQEVRSIVGFGRVMIYRFLDDSSGLVIAEARSAKSKAYFNHRFPSSDIPQQARDLYRRNLIRTIPDVAYRPRPIVPAPAVPVDLTQSLLRSISPLHIQYLHNMQVGASMSISLLVDGDLWGLIACHHEVARDVRVEAQLLCRHVATSLSAFILNCSQADMTLLEGLQRDAVEKVLRKLRSSSDPERTLRTSAAELKELIQCSGFVLLSGGEIVAAAGRTPEPAVLHSLAPQVEAHLKTRASYWTDRVAEALSGTGPNAATASGLMAIRLDASQPLLAMWFRPEQIEEIAWAGDPSFKLPPADILAPLTPRRSFATWRESVRGRSRPWMWYEINAIELFQPRAGHTLQRHRLKRLNIQLAEANAGLSALATTDPLTGLPNRRLFDERLVVEWANALREEKSLGLVAIDVDHFKQYNDRFGHPAGDLCLKQVAAAIEGARRTIDIAARVGGEEFAILLPNADEPSTAAVADRVRRAIEDLALEHPQGEDGVITISVGTAVGSPAQMANFSDLMSAADRALYIAKANGRNRVVVSA